MNRFHGRLWATQPPFSLHIVIYPTRGRLGLAALVSIGVRGRESNTLDSTSTSTRRDTESAKNRVALFNKNLDSLSRDGDQHGHTLRG